MYRIIFFFDPSMFSLQLLQLHHPDNSNCFNYIVRDRCPLPDLLIDCFNSSLYQSKIQHLNLPLTTSNTDTLIGWSSSTNIVHAMARDNTDSEKYVDDFTKSAVTPELCLSGDYTRYVPVSAPLQRLVKSSSQSPIVIQISGIWSTAHLQPKASSYSSLVLLQCSALLWLNHSVIQITILLLCFGSNLKTGRALVDVYCLLGAASL